MPELPENNFIDIAGLFKKTLFLIAIAMGIFLISGFIRFWVIVAQYGDLPIPLGEGIVVLTGGNARIETGLHLLEKGNAKRMLISGVNPNTSANAIAGSFPAHFKLFSCCIELDHLAKNTAQNAAEITKWMNSYKFKRVIVVTSNYHMPRALLELRRTMPDSTLLSYSVRREFGIVNAGVGNFDDLAIMVNEFLKTLAASFGYNKNAWPM